MRRLAELLTFLAPAVVVLAGCGEAHEAPVEAKSFPLRVLEDEAVALDAEHTAFEDELDSLEGWSSLSCAGGTFELRPAAELAQAGALRQHEGRVTLPPATVLVRRVTLQQSGEHSLSARLRGPAALVGDACPNLMLVPAWTDLGSEADQLQRLGKALSGIWRSGGNESSSNRSAEWRQNAGPGDFALARWLSWIEVGEAGGAPTWIVIAALDAPLEVDRVRVSVSPQLHPGSDDSTDVPIDTREIAIERVRIGGDSRIAAFVPPRRVLSLPVVVPPEAVDFVLGVCPDPTLIKRMRQGDRRNARWSVRAQPGDHLLAEVSETATSERPLCFTDHVLAWPPGLAGEVTLEFSVTGATGMVFGQPRVRGPEQPAAPSLLLISIDTLRADHLGFLGYDRPTSPYLDELAARGTVFTDVTSVSSYTLPTHASLFTGLFPPRHLALDTSDRINSQRTPTLALLLSEAGFITGAFTGGGFVSGDYGFDAGFDRYVTVDPVPLAHELGEGGMATVSAWVRRAGHRPWFGFLHTYAVHDYAPPAEDLALFEREPMPEGFDPYELIDGRDPRVTPPTGAELDRLVDLYDATIHHVDRRLRALLEPLRAEGLLDHTWIVVTSDHGEELLEHGRLRHRGTVYQELVHVPLLIVPPDGAAGDGTSRRVDEPVSQVDVFATLLELLEQPLPPDGDGRSLASFVRGSHPPGQPTPLYTQVERRLHARASLRAGPWKLIRGDTSGERIEPAAEAWELFDLEHDAGEQHDLAAERGDERDALRLALEEVEAALTTPEGERTRFEPDEDLLRRLAELGYLAPSR